MIDIVGLALTTLVVASVAFMIAMMIITIWKQVRK